MVGWNLPLYGFEFEQTWRDSERQGSLEVLQFMRSQRVRDNLVLEQQQQDELDGQELAS